MEHRPSLEPEVGARKRGKRGIPIENLPQFNRSARTALVQVTHDRDVARLTEHMIRRTMRDGITRVIESIDPRFYGLSS